MLQLVSKAFGYLIHSKSNDTCTFDNWDEGDLASREGPNKCLRKVFSGTVTNFYDGRGLIDDHVYFAIESVIGGQVPIPGCNVQVEAERSHENGGWIAQRVDVINPWDSDTEEDTKPETRAGQVTFVKSAYIQINGVLEAKRSMCIAGYKPFRGDFVQFEVIQLEDNCTEVILSLWPTREKTCIGTVTELLTKYGFVDQDIYFHFSTCTKGYYPRQGDRVKVSAVESKQVRGEWRAQSIEPIDRYRYLEEVRKNDMEGKQQLDLLMEDKEGIYISNDLQFRAVQLGTRKVLPCTIRNLGCQEVIFRGIRFPTDDDQFQITYEDELQTMSQSEKFQLGLNGIITTEDVLLYPGAKCNPRSKWLLLIEFHARHLGRNEQLAVFIFDRCEIGRLLSGVVLDPSMKSIECKQPYSGRGRQERVEKHDMELNVIPGQKPIRRRKTVLPKHLKQYQIPNDIRRCLLEGHDLQLIISSVAMPLSRKTHRVKLSALLHVEELKLENEMENFDLHKVTLRPFSEFLLLPVPGLAEGRPSLLVGDKIVLKFSDAIALTRYEGFLHEVRAEDVLVKFNAAFHQMYRNENCDIHFYSNRTTTRRCHQALETGRDLDDQVLFPTKVVPKYPLVSPLQVEGLQFINHLLNSRQQAAVKRILSGQGRPSIYLVFGPPGTGKTITLVEAILQVFKHIKQSRILVTAPSNSAADLVALRLHQSGIISKKDLVRFNAFQRTVEVPEEIEKYCLRESDDLGLACRRRIIVSTCSTSGQLLSLGLQSEHFSHVFVDEAGQATEPECLIPVSIVTGNTEAQIVLAGDPRQLGAVLRSPLALKYGLDISLLERLMDRLPYDRNVNKFGVDGGYDPLIVTKLINNYRSHPDLLELSSTLFYDAELRPHADCQLVNIFIGSELLVNRNCPLIFHGLRGEDMREGDSPSWFNPTEAVQVMKYVQKIVGKFNHIQPSDIGVVTPYRKQVAKIRVLLDRVELTDIKVGSVEEFQGQERLVIVISTVRSDESLIDFDVRHNIGFLSNPKRFNVAITRAAALMIIIGNPHVLCQDPYWCALLQYSVIKEAYTGCQLPSLSDPVVLGNFQRAKHLLLSGHLPEAAEEEQTREGSEYSFTAFSGQDGMVQPFEQSAPKESVCNVGRTDQRIERGSNSCVTVGGNSLNRQQVVEVGFTGPDQQKRLSRKDLGYDYGNGLTSSEEKAGRTTTKSKSHAYRAFIGSLSGYKQLQEPVRTKKTNQEAVSKSLSCKNELILATGFHHVVSNIHSKENGSSETKYDHQIRDVVSVANISPADEESRTDFTLQPGSSSTSPFEERSFDILCTTDRTLLRKCKKEQRSHADIISTFKAEKASGSPEEERK